MKADIRKKFGKLVRCQRRRWKMTLAELGQKSRLSKGLLSKIENGEGNPCLTSIERIAQALKVMIRIY